MRKTRFGALTPLVVLAIGLGGYLSIGVGTAAAQEPSQLEFHRDIRPILAESCLLCHGPNEAIRQADLRFDTDEFLDRVVVPGDAEASALYERLTTEDPIRKMPPAGMSLSDEQIDLVRQWIDGGAEMGTALADADVPAIPQRTVDFAREVRPILSENCFTCHGPGRRGAPARPAAGRGGRALLESRRVRRAGHHSRERRREPADPPGERRRRPGPDALPAGPEHPGHAGHRRGRPRTPARSRPSGCGSIRGPSGSRTGRSSRPSGSRCRRWPAPSGSATRSTTSSRRGSSGKAGNRLPRPTSSRCSAASRSI